ncbi:MAG: M23 family metallopeptidase, partial [Flavobacteriales bacterium]
MRYKAYLSLIFFTVFFIFVTDVSVIGDGGEDENEKTDSLNTTPLFSEDFLFKNYHLSYQKLKSIKDSLMKLDPIPEKKVERINMYLNLNKKSKAELIDKIDSLFSLDSIPKEKINMIRLYKALNERKKDKFMLIPYDTTEYPANYYYESWNTKTPTKHIPNRRRSTLTKDTSFTLCLKDTNYNCGYHYPIKQKDEPITSKYGSRDNGFHRGIDIDLRVWDKVYSTFPGMVRFVGRFGGFGRVIVVRHYNGLETLYAHLHRYKVKEGDIVNAGDVIGLGGSSGNSTGSHLHYEVRFKGKSIDPNYIIDFNDNKDLRGDTVIVNTTGKSFLNAYPKGTEFHTVKYGDYL